LPRTYFTEAIVLGSHKLGDADRVVTLFTAERGKTPTVVKGVRKVKSRFGGRLEPFTHLQVQLHEGRNLHTLTGADTVRTHATVRDTPAALKAGLSFINMVMRTTTDLEPRPRTFNLLDRFLGELENLCRGQAPVPSMSLLALAAELKLLLLAGYLPRLSSCAACGATGGLPRFSAALGGALCKDCGGDAFNISGQSLGLMRHMLETPLAAIGTLEAETWELEEVWRSLGEICRFHLDVDLKIAPW